MRNLGLLPYVGLIKPTDKIPLGSYIQDIEEMHRKTIDPVTGRMFLKHSLQDDIRDRRIREKDALDRKIKGLEGNPPPEDSKEEAAKEKSRRDYIREFDLDMPVTKPDKLYREWMIAKQHAVQDPDGSYQVIREDLEKQLNQNFKAAGIDVSIKRRESHSKILYSCLQI